MSKFLHNQKGQTTVEYLMLMAVVFFIAYLVVTKPVSTFTEGMIQQLRDVTENVVRNGEISGKGLNPGAPGHPTDRERLKAVHL